MSSSRRTGDRLRLRLIRTEVGAGRFADRHQRGRELADDRESAWSKLTQQHGYDHRCDRCDPDDEELDRTE